ncbi:MAG TPA: methyltransferase domain-containing protein [Thermoleophilaceae bacterium]|nr:methyltransferase domain-containing protein [Thermoleophilaceae bacterium]
MRGVSERLRRFADEQPFERRPILEFMVRAAGELPANAKVADVGAGDSPYRELFDHTEYLATDWSESVHEAEDVRVVAPADDLPFGEASFDAVLFTQVLEHVQDPPGVLAELLRVLRPGGRLYLSAPLVWELHELPHDYWRFTEGGLRLLIEAAGFAEVAVEPRGDSFTTLAQLMRNVPAMIGEAPDGLDGKRREAAEALVALSDELAALAPLDTRRLLPLGYCATATRP